MVDPLAQGSENGSCLWSSTAVLCGMGPTLEKLLCMGWEPCKGASLKLAPVYVLPSRHTCWFTDPFAEFAAGE